MIKTFQSFLKYIKYFPNWRYNLGLLRKEMPQIPKEYYNEFLQYVKQNGFNTSVIKINPLQIIPTQSEISDEKVQKIIHETNENVKSIFKNERFICAKFKNDVYLLDGHHRIAALNEIIMRNGEEITISVDVVECSIQELLFLGRAFDKSFVKDLDEGKNVSKQLLHISSERDIHGLSISK